MTFLVWLIAFGIFMQSAMAWGLRGLFKPKKKAVQAQKKKNKPRNIASPTPTPSPSPQPEDKKIIKREGVFFAVESQWLAQYRIFEAAWDYPIPEDDDIRFIDGKYHVPAVVYRHYEDMEKTPKVDHVDR